MTDLYDISANPKDPIDREKVRDTLVRVNDLINGKIDIEKTALIFDPIIEAATAWLEAADDMPEMIVNPMCSWEEKAHNTLLAIMKKMLRI